MAKQRKTYSAELKSRIALEAIKAQMTVKQIATHYAVHPNQVTTWKKQVLAEVSQFFSRARTRAVADEEELKAQLYQQIGQLKVELDWLKKKLDGSVAEKRRLIEPVHPHLPVARQCQLLGLSRAGFYYAPCGESADHLRLMRLLDEQYPRTPFYGVCRMTAWLRAQGYQVNQKRVRRRRRLMGLEAIYQKPRLSDPAPGHRIYPYRLRGVPIERVNQVWSTDITYIRLRPGAGLPGRDY